VARWIKKIVRRMSLKDSSSARRDREYWLSRPSSERFEAIETLRRQFWGDAVDQPIARVVKRSNLKDQED
jgi:hypothetical protein